MNENEKNVDEALALTTNSQSNPTNNEWRLTISDHCQELYRNSSQTKPIQHTNNHFNSDSQSKCRLP